MKAEGVIGTKCRTAGVRGDKVRAEGGRGGKSGGCQRYRDTVKSGAAK